MSDVFAERPSPYRLHVEMDTASLNIEGIALTNGGTAFSATLQNLHGPTEATFGRLPVPQDPTDAEAYFLFKPNTGIPDRYNKPGRYAAIVRHLGFLYEETNDVQQLTWTKRMRFQYPSLDDSRKNAAQLFEPTSVRLVPTEIGFYSPAQFLEPLSQGERIIPTASLPWQLHDQAYHTPAEYTYGPEFNHLRRKLAGQLLDQQVKRPDPEKMKRAMLRDDALSEMITHYATRSDGSDEIPAYRITLPQAFSFFFNSPAFTGTDVERLLRARPRNPGEEQPFIMDIAEELRHRLATASERLLAINA